MALLFLWGMCVSVVGRWGDLEFGCVQLLFLGNISRKHTLDQMLEEIGEPVHRWRRKVQEE